MDDLRVPLFQETSICYPAVLEHSHGHNGQKGLVSKTGDFPQQTVEIARGNLPFTDHTKIPSGSEMHIDAPFTSVAFYRLVI